MLTEQEKTDFRRTVYLIAYVLLLRQYREIQDQYNQFLYRLKNGI